MSQSTPKKKSYEVRIKAFATVLVVGAEDEEQALLWAEDSVDMGDMQLDDMVAEKLSEDGASRLRRHADAVVDS